MMQNNQCLMVSQETVNHGRGESENNELQCFPVSARKLWQPGLIGKNGARLLLLFVLLLPVAGCAVKGPEAEPVRPAPAVEQKETGATAELLQEAERALEAGDYTCAEQQMERALRIAPRNARVWHTMARVRYGQGSCAQAVQMCRKSNSLAGQDRDLQRQNWMLMEKAYCTLGDKAAAEEARRKAQTGQ
ncbi:MAG: tetratricopeptide repeat protein [Thermodesulfobacteriota bacterium]